MVRFHIFSAMVVLALAISPGIAREIIDEGIEPAYFDDFTPSRLVDVTPYLDEINFLNECAEKLTPTCGEQVYISIFKNETIITDVCCTKLVSTGHRCHTELVQTIMDTPDPDLDMSDALSKSVQTWKKCVAVAKAASPSPSYEN